VEEDLGVPLPFQRWYRTLAPSSPCLGIPVVSLLSQVEEMMMCAWSPAELLDWFLPSPSRLELVLGGAARELTPMEGDVWRYRYPTHATGNTFVRHYTASILC
jgi:hypothetical protein